MKYAIVNQNREEAKKGAIGVCPVCGGGVLAKCGNIRVPHWAHVSTTDCDHWWEPETEWHRAWKNHFPPEWQEVIHYAENGEKHIADVKTDKGWVIEFQHSNIHPDERRAREQFYKKLVWVVDGTRRSRDSDQLLAGWEYGVTVDEQVGLRRLVLPCKSALLRDWSQSGATVFFDVSDGSERYESQPTLFAAGSAIPDSPRLWMLVATVGTAAYLMPFPETDFVHFLRFPSSQNQDPFDKLLYCLGVKVGAIKPQRPVGKNEKFLTLLRDYERWFRAHPRRTRERL